MSTRSVGWGHGGPATYVVDVVVAGGGSKAVITAQNNAAINEHEVLERLYCS